MIVEQPLASPVTESRTAGEPLARLCGVSVDLGLTPVLRGLDLTVVPGEVLGVLGANGSGKSTLLRVLATLLPPTRGNGSVLGTDLSDRRCMAEPLRISLIGHEPALYPQLSLRDNVRFVARLVGHGDDEVERVLAAAGVADAGVRRGEQCSHGMLRRTELARVLLTGADLLLLDEPHAGLDAGATALVDYVIDTVCGHGGGCVIVSHDRERLHAMADRLVEVTAGRAWPFPPHGQEAQR